MSTPAYECHLIEPDPIPTRHPLAHRSGAHALASMIAAGQIWRPLTNRCRDALYVAYNRALRDALATGTNPVPLPRLVGEVHPATVRALVRRGLVADQHLTPLGCEVTRWSIPVERRRVTTVEPTGDAL